MNKHTPGPWKLNYGTVEASDKTPIAAVRLCGGSMAQESDANAALIAASPDLLAALQWAMRVIDENEIAFVGSGKSAEFAARAAIARAEGR